MCGLVGVVTKAQNGFGNGEKASFHELLYVDALRGEDSTGVCGIFNDGSAIVHKDAYEAAWFMCDTEYDELLSSLWKKGQAVFGHNRKKTVGNISAQTAHPFVIENDFVFMHNGTLTSHKELADTEVDSEALGIHIRKAMREGGKAALEEAMGKVRGAYACVWYDQLEEKLYMMRNNQRPLWLATGPSGYAFCSEPLFLAAILQRNNIKYTDISAIEEETLYSIPLNEGYQGMAVNKEKLQVKKATPPTTHTTHNILQTTRAVVEGQTNNALPGKTQTTGKTTTAKTVGDCTKNSFKRITKQLLGQRIGFWMDDYVEKNHPIVDGNYYLFGSPFESNDFPNNTIIRTSVKDLLPEDIDNLMSRSATGVVYSTQYDKKSRSMIIYVDKVKTKYGDLNSVQIESSQETPTALH